MRKQIIQIFHNMIGTGAQSHSRADEDTLRQGVLQDIEFSPVERNGVAQMVDQKSFERIVDEALGTGQARGCLLLLSLDRFKEVNRIYGYDTGDFVLSSATDVLRNVFGGSYLRRAEGDKFAVWIPWVSESGTERILRQVGMANDRLLHPAGDLPPVSLSAGAVFGQTGDDYRSLGKKAQKSLYKVKESGRCGCAVYGRQGECPF